MSAECGTYYWCLQPEKLENSVFTSVKKSVECVFFINGFFNYKKENSQCVPQQEGYTMKH